MHAHRALGRPTTPLRLGALALALALFSPLAVTAADSPTSAAAAALPAASASAAGGPAIKRIKDRPNARMQHKANWYGERAASVSKGRSRTGGPFSADYRRYLLSVAQQERQRWGQLIAGVDAEGQALSDEALRAAAPKMRWKNIGPTQSDFIRNGNIELKKVDAGRVTEVVFHPKDANTIYAAFSGGGLWKTTDSGANWKPLTENLGSLAAGAVAIDPEQPETLYLGLGDAFDGTGIGLVKSTTGGKTWSAPVFLGDSRVINHILVSPTNSSVVWVATDKGLYRSTNAGQRFDLVTLDATATEAPYAWSVISTGGNGLAVSIEAAATASTPTQGQVWVSSDGGAHWTRGSGISAANKPIGRVSVASAPSQPATLYAMAAVAQSSETDDLADIFVSKDAGLTWTAKNVTGKRYTNPNFDMAKVGTLLGGQGYYNQLVMVDPANPDLAYFGGQLGLVKTSDGGQTFTVLSNWLAQYKLPYLHADFHAGAIRPGTMIVGTDGGLARSTDGGKTFDDKINVGIASHLVYTVGASPAAPNAVIGGFQDNGTRVRSGRESTFNQVIGGDGFGAAIHRKDPKLMIGSLYYGQVLKSTDGGATFNYAVLGLSDAGNPSYPFFTPVVNWEGSGGENTLLTYSNTRLYVSTNFAGSWQPKASRGLPTDDFAIRGVTAHKTSAQRIGMVTSGGRVFISTNGGDDFTQTAALPNNGYSLSKIAFDPVRTDTFYVASVADDATKDHLWKTTDGGASYTAISGNGLPVGIPINTVVVDPKVTQTLYVGTELGVYRSLNGGASWARFGRGLPLVNATDLVLAPNGKALRISTFGRGFWEIRLD